MKVHNAGDPRAPGYMWHGEGGVPSSAGDATFSQTHDAISRWATDLQTEHGAVEKEVQEVRSSLAQTEKHASGELRRLSAQRSRQDAVLHDLGLYEKGLEVKSPVAAAASRRRPVRRPPRDEDAATSGMSPPPLPSEPELVTAGAARNLASAFGDDPTAQEAADPQELEVRLVKSPSQLHTDEVHVESPINAQHKYLHEAESAAIEAGVNSPVGNEFLVNPDVKPRWHGQKSLQ